jgi:hypothetical protein
VHDITERGTVLPSKKDIHMAGAAAAVHSMVLLPLLLTGRLLVLVVVAVTSAMPAVSLITLTVA